MRDSPACRSWKPHHPADVRAGTWHNVDRRTGFRGRSNLASQAESLIVPFFELSRNRTSRFRFSVYFRCDTGDLARLPQFTPNVYQIGVGVALVSLSAFFIGLILAYSLRIQVQPVWRQFHVPDYLWFSTAALAASSAVLEGAKYSLRRAAISKYRWRLQLCLALGITFLVLQTTSATDLLHQGVAAEGNPHGSAFYVFMSIHAVHLLGGLGWSDTFTHGRVTRQHDRESLAKTSRVLSRRSDVLALHGRGVGCVVLLPDSLDRTVTLSKP